MVAPRAASAHEEEEARWIRFRAGLGGNLALWIAPSDLAFEGALEIGLRFPMFSVSGEFRGSPPAGSKFPLDPPLEGAATVRTARLSGAIVPCFHWPLSTSGLKPTPLGCAMIQGGGVFVSGNGLDSAPAVPYWAAGGRIGLELDLIQPLTARLAADFLGVPLRPSIHLLGQQLWAVPAFSMAIGGALVVTFP